MGVHGSTDNVRSTLKPLSPLARLPLGIPFLYQRVISTSPMGLLIGSRSSQASFAIVDMDGRLDWKVVQRNGLLAWVGSSLMVEPTINPRMVRYNEQISHL